MTFHGPFQPKPFRDATKTGQSHHFALREVLRAVAEPASAGDAFARPGFPKRIATRLSAPNLKLIASLKDSFFSTSRALESQLVTVINLIMNAPGSGRIRGFWKLRLSL